LNTGSMARIALFSLVGIGAVAVVGMSPASALPPNSPEGIALLTSSKPATIVLDPATGNAVAVFPGSPPASALHDAAALQTWTRRQATAEVNR
jgi:hypothetical protein